jgi:hypothetical protein
MEFSWKPAALPAGGLVRPLYQPIGRRGMPQRESLSRGCAMRHREHSEIELSELKIEFISEIN